MRRSFFATLILVVFSCSDKDKVPADILPQQKMQAVLWDMATAGEFLDAFVFRDTSVDRNATALAWYDSIYILHRITKTEFQKSYTWYKDHPAVMKVLLDSLAKKPEPPLHVPGQVSPPDTTTLRTDTSVKRPATVPNKARMLQLPDSQKKRRLLRFAK